MTEKTKIPDIVLAAAELRKKCAERYRREDDEDLICACYFCRYCEGGYNYCALTGDDEFTAHDWNWRILNCK